MARATTTSKTPAAPKAHPLYADFQPEWVKLAHVREGTGGFMDGTYLIAHPREWEDHESPTPRVPTKKLKARRALACYENIAATIIEAKKSALFRETVTRRVGDAPDTPIAPAVPPPKDPTKPKAAGGAAEDEPPEPTPAPAPVPTKKPKTPVELWWENVDGRKTGIDDYIKAAWDPGATFGYMVIYMDRPKGPEPQTAADQQMPILRAYTPIDLVDWAVDDNGELMEVKLLEAAPRTLNDPASQQLNYRVRYITRETWQLQDKDGTALEQGDHQMGTLPVVLLYTQRRPLTPIIGQSVLGQAQLYIDVYNLRSETRELLRNQVFSILNVPLGSGPDAMSVEDAKKLMGTKIGTDNVLFSGLAASFITAAAENVEVYQKEIADRLRTIYRCAGVPWEADSRDAEAEGSHKLKREELNQRLSSYADEIEKAEYKLVELFYRAMHGADAYEKALEKDQVVIRYPDTFDITPFAEVLEQAQAAISLGMPALFLKELRKRLVSKFMPDLPPATEAAITAAIDGAPDDLTPAERMKERIKATSQALKEETAA